MKALSDIPFLTLRANDWVPEVSAAATVLLDGRLTAANRHQVIDALPFILRMIPRSRRDHGHFLETTVAALVADGGTAVLERAPGFPASIRRFVYQAVWRHSPAPDNAVLRVASADGDVTARAQATRWLLDCSDRAMVVPQLERMLNDAAPVVRSQALQALVARAPDRAAGRVTASLVDSAASVRSLARFLAKKLSLPLVPRDFYVQQLTQASGATLAAAVDGVGETGKPEDEPLVDVHSTSSSTQVRKAVLGTRARLVPARGVALAMAALPDDPMLRSAAVTVLAMHPHLIDFQALAHSCRQMRGTLTAGKILRLFRKAPKWDVPSLLIDALPDASETDRVMALQQLEGWIASFARSQVAPSSAQLERVHDRLRAHGSLLPPSLAAELEFLASHAAGVR